MVRVQSRLPMKSTGYSAVAVTRFSFSAPKGPPFAGFRWTLWRLCGAGVPHPYMNAPYASLSIHDNAKVKIAPVHSDCECSFWLRSLMGSAGWRLDRLHALWVLRSARAWSTTVLPVLPSLHDRLSNRWYFSLKSLCGLLLRGWPSVTRPRPPSCNPSRSAGHGQAAPRRFEHSCWPARPPRHSCCAAAPLR